MALDYPGLASGIHINLGAANVPAGNDKLSITAWINPDAVGLGDEQVIIAKSNSSGNVGAFKMQVEATTNELRGIVNSDSLDSGGGISAAVWTFVAMVYNGVTKKLFINAVEDGSEAQIGNVVTSADPLRLGALDNGGIVREFDGPLDDIRVYTRALSLAELQTMRISLGVDGIVDGLLWRWTQRELSPGIAATIAGSIKDLRGNLNGTPVNSPVYQTGILRI